MNCNWTVERETDYLDGLLKKAEHAEYEDHLRDCGVCRDRHAERAVIDSRLVNLASKLRRPSAAAVIVARAGQNTAAKRSRVRYTRSAIHWLGWPAAAVFVAWAAGLLPAPFARYDAANSVWAAIARRVQETQSVRMQMCFSAPGGVQMTGEILATPARARIQEADGNIGVGEFATGRAIAIIEADHRVIEWTEPLPIPNLYELFRDLQLQADQPREEELDGRRMLVFSARVLAKNATVWVDAATRLPHRFEYDESMPSQGQFVSGRVVASDIRWDEPFDPALLSLEPPAGYVVERQPPNHVNRGDAPASTASAAEDTLARENYMAGPLEVRLKNLVFGCLVFIQNNPAESDSWPADMERIRKYCHPGTFRNPNRPELDVGFAYIRPSGRPRWDPPADRRLAFYEILEVWPGAGWVAYTDGSLERVDDLARFESLIDAAKRASHASP